MIHSSIFWLWVSLAILFLVIRKLASQTIKNVLDGKRREIDLFLHEAEQHRFQQEKALEEIKQTRLHELQEAQKIIERAQQDAEHLKSEAFKKSEEAILYRRQLIDKHIREAHEAAQRSIQSYVATKAIATSRHVLETSVAQEKSQDFIDQALEEIPAKFARA